MTDDKEKARRALEAAGVVLLDGPFLDFRDPWGNRIEIVGYDNIQFTKAPNVLRGMGLKHLTKNENAKKRADKKRHGNRVGSDERAAAVLGAIAQRGDTALVIAGAPFFSSPSADRSMGDVDGGNVAVERTAGSGAAFSGTSVTELFHRAPDLVERILTGEAPANLPVEQPTKFEFVVNLRAAKALSLEISPGLLARAGEVIEPTR